ncbi:MAG: hypothetical protein KDA21_00550 [Phycisphaerales bacterium]|nr:hypothetical protein [Phycisphaerales bacterium]
MMWSDLARRGTVSVDDWRSAVTRSMLGTCRGRVGDNSPTTEHLLSSSLALLMRTRGSNSREARAACVRYCNWLESVGRPASDAPCSVSSDDGA